jgi:negative regulator of replication initiation
MEITKIQLDKNLYQDVKNTSRFIGVDAEEIINRALVLYLDSVQQITALNQEFQAWDVLSDEALIGMEDTVKK